MNFWKKKFPILFLTANMRINRNSNIEIRKIIKLLDSSIHIIVLDFI